jgi:Kelch motif
LAAIPTEREHLGAAALDGMVYAVGGRLGANLGTAEVFDPAADAWSTVADLPAPRSGIAVVALAAAIHLLGGEGIEPPMIFDEHEVLAAATGAWSIARPSSRGRHGFGAVVIDARICAVGGGSKPDLSATDRVDILTPAA